MPQMNPANWTILLLVFNFLLMLLSSKIHFFSFVKPFTRGGNDYKKPGSEFFFLKI